MSDMDFGLDANYLLYTRSYSNGLIVFHQFAFTLRFEFHYNNSNLGKKNN